MFIRLGTGILAIGVWAALLTWGQPAFAQPSEPATSGENRASTYGDLLTSALNRHFQTENKVAFGLSEYRISDVSLATRRFTVQVEADGAIARVIGLPAGVPPTVPTDSSAAEAVEAAPLIALLRGIFEARSRPGTEIIVSAEALAARFTLEGMNALEAREFLQILIDLESLFTRPEDRERIASLLNEGTEKAQIHLLEIPEKLNLELSRWKVLRSLHETGRIRLGPHGYFHGGHLVLENRSVALPSIRSGGFWQSMPPMPGILSAPESGTAFDPRFESYLSNLFDLMAFKEITGAIRPDAALEKRLEALHIPRQELSTQIELEQARDFIQRSFEAKFPLEEAPSEAKLKAISSFTSLLIMDFASRILDERAARHMATLRALAPLQDEPSKTKVSALQAWVLGRMERMLKREEALSEFKKYPPGEMLRALTSEGMEDPITAKRVLGTIGAPTGFFLHFWIGGIVAGSITQFIVPVLSEAERQCRANNAPADQLCVQLEGPGLWQMLENVEFWKGPMYFAISAMGAEFLMRSSQGVFTSIDRLVTSGKFTRAIGSFQNQISSQLFRSLSGSASKGLVGSYFKLQAVTFLGRQPHMFLTMLIMEMLFTPNAAKLTLSERLWGKDGHPGAVEHAAQITVSFFFASIAVRGGIAAGAPMTRFVLRAGVDALKAVTYYRRMQTGFMAAKATVETATAARKGNPISWAISELIIGGITLGVEMFLAHEIQKAVFEDAKATIHSKIITAEGLKREKTEPATHAMKLFVENFHPLSWVEGGDRWKSLRNRDYYVEPRDPRLRQLQFRNGGDGIYYRVSPAFVAQEITNQAPFTFGTLSPFRFDKRVSSPIQDLVEELGLFPRGGNIVATASDSAPRRAPQFPFMEAFQYTADEFDRHFYMKAFQMACMTAHFSTLESSVPNDRVRMAILDKCLSMLPAWIEGHATARTDQRRAEVLARLGQDIVGAEIKYWDSSDNEKSFKITREFVDKFRAQLSEYLGQRDGLLRTARGNGQAGTGTLGHILVPAEKEGAPPLSSVGSLILHRGRNSVGGQHAFIADAARQLRSAVGGAGCPAFYELDADRVERIETLIYSTMEQPLLEVAQKLHWSSGNWNSCYRKLQIGPFYKFVLFFSELLATEYQEIKQSGRLSHLDWNLSLFDMLRKNSYQQIESLLKSIPPEYSRFRVHMERVSFHQITRLRTEVGIPEEERRRGLGFQPENYIFLRRSENTKLPAPDMKYDWMEDFDHPPGWDGYVEACGIELYKYPLYSHMSYFEYFLYSGMLLSKPGHFLIQWKNYDTYAPECQRYISKLNQLGVNRDGSYEGADTALYPAALLLAAKIKMLSTQEAITSRLRAVKAVCERELPAGANPVHALSHSCVKEELLRFRFDEFPRSAYPKDDPSNKIVPQFQRYQLGDTSRFSPDYGDSSIPEVRRLERVSDLHARNMQPINFPSGYICTDTDPGRSCQKTQTTELGLLMDQCLRFKWDEEGNFTSELKRHCEDLFLGTTTVMNQDVADFSTALLQELAHQRAFAKAAGSR